MPTNSWVGLANNTSADGTALTASTSETSILSPLHKIVLPASYFDSVGKKFRVTAAGRVSNIVTTPGTLTLRLKLGSIAIFNGGAMALNTVAKTNVPWWLELLGEIRTVGNGTAATAFVQGGWLSESVIGSPAASAGGSGEHLLPYNTAPVVGAGFDSTASQQIDLTAQWSLSNANSIQCHLFALELLN